ncbi:MAG: LytR C-terminal domain-containing protein [Candidatus Moraniibacteriota bacterium]
MFNTKEILFITPSAIRGFSIRSGKVNEIVNLSWTTENVRAVLGTARAALGRNVRLLVGEQFTYVATFLLPKDANYASLEEERIAVRDLAEKFIPENLMESAWDYQEISLPDISLGRPVQVVALVASFARVVVPALKEAGFRIPVTLPESCAVARLFVDWEEPFLLVYKGDFFFVAGVVRGRVLSSTTSLQELTFETVESVGRFMKDRFGFSSSRILFTGSCTENDLVNFDRTKAERAGFSIEFSDKSALLGLATKKDVSGSDPSVLSVELSVVEKGDDTEESSETESKTNERFRPHALDERTSSERLLGQQTAAYAQIPRRTKVLAMLFVIVVLLGGGSIILLRKKQAISLNMRDNIPLEQSETPSIEDAPSLDTKDEGSVSSPASVPSEEDVPEVTHASFRVVLENGSGISGAASHLKEDLVAEKFVISAIRTAESSHAVSFVRAKASVPEEFLDELLANAGLDFSLERRRDISEDAGEDVVLVLGSDVSDSL